MLFSNDLTMLFYVVFWSLVAALVISIGTYLFFKLLLPEFTDPNLFKLQDRDVLEAKNKKKLVPEKPKIESFEHESYHAEDLA